MNTQHITEHLQELDRQLAKCTSPAEGFALSQQRKKIMDQLAMVEQLKSPVMVVKTADFHPVNSHFDMAIIDDLVDTPAPPHVQAEVERQLDKIFAGSECKIETATQADVRKERELAQAVERLVRRKNPNYVPPVRAPRRHKLVRVSMPSLSMLMTCFTMGNTFRFEMDLPQGSRMVRWFPDQVSDCLCMIFEHESFADVPDGEEIPEAPPGSFRVVT